MKSEVQGLRSRGRQKKRWMDMIQEDLKFLNLKPDDTGRRDTWRQRIQVADPSPAGDYFTPEGKEDYIHTYRPIEYEAPKTTRVLNEN